MSHGLLAPQLGGVADVVQVKNVVELCSFSLLRLQQRVCSQWPALYLGDAHVPQSKDGESLEELTGALVQGEHDRSLVSANAVVFRGIPEKKKEKGTWFRPEKAFF